MMRSFDSRPLGPLSGHTLARSVLAASVVTFSLAGAVGMSRIVPAQAAMRTIIGWILLTSLCCAWRIGRGVRTGIRRASLRGGVAPRLRIAEVTISLALLGVLLWSVSQEYLFTSSVFPDSSVWLGASLLLLSFVLLASALLIAVLDTSHTGAALDSTALRCHLLEVLADAGRASRSGGPPHARQFSGRA